MLSTLFDVDGVTAVEILVKTAAYSASLAAAGSVLARLTLSRLDGETARATRRLAVAGAAAAAVASVLRVPVRASFLMGGTFSGAFEPTIVGMVVESPLGASLGVRLAGLALVCLVIVDDRRTRIAAGLGAVLVCTSFVLRGHALDEPRLVLGLLLTLHLLGLAFWVGILAPLHRLAGRDAAAAGALAAEFSTWAVRIVPALAAAGAALFVILTSDPLAALSTPYGQLLAVKLLLFVPLLGLAALNKCRLTPDLEAEVAGAGARLRRSIRFEALIVLAILATTATLTTVTSPEQPERGNAPEAESSAALPASPRNHGPAYAGRSAWVRGVAGSEETGVGVVLRNREPTPTSISLRIPTGSRCPNRTIGEPDYVPSSSARFTRRKWGQGEFFALAEGRMQTPRGSEKLTLTPFSP